MLESRIVRNGNVFLLEINGKTIPMYGYMSYQPAKADYEAFRNAGIHLFFTGVYAGDRGINQRTGIRPFRPGFWKGYGEYDFSAVDEDFHIILDGGKEGEDYLIPRLMIEPPSWWEKDNPEELCRDAAGTPVHQSFHSRKWLHDTAVMMAAFQQWLKDSGWDRYVPGWHIACGSTEEFFRPVQHPLQLSDYSERAESAFIDWAKEHYRDIGALNAAWHRNYEDFSQIRIPNPAQRMFGCEGALKDPDLECYAIDYYRFLNESHAQSLIDLCETAKEITRHKQVIGAFFGYANTGTEQGHHAFIKVLNSSAVDFLAAPLTYTDARAQGVDFAFQGSVESASLHGKPSFVEADIRTCLSRPISQCMPFADPYVNRAYDGPVWWGPDTISGSLGQMKKAFARVLTHNTAVWWFDMWGGWYRDPELMEFHRKAAEIYRTNAEKGGSENAAPIALFVDDEIFYEAGQGNLPGRIALFYSKTLGFAGTPYRMYMMDDFENVDPCPFTVALFCCVRHWTEAQKKALGRWKTGGRILAFTGPLDLSYVTGVRVHRFDELEPLPGDLMRHEDPLEVRKLRFIPSQGDVVLEKAADGGAVSLLRRQDAYSVYVTTTVDPAPETVRMLTAASSGQIYAFDGDIVYASKEFLGIHAASDGIKQIAFPLRARLADVFTGNVLPGNETYVHVKMQKGDTLLCRIEPLDGKG